MPLRSSRSSSLSDKTSMVSRSRSISPEGTNVLPRGHDVGDVPAVGQHGPGLTTLALRDGLLPRPRVLAGRVQAVERQGDRLLAHGSRVRRGRHPQPARFENRSSKVDVMTPGWHRVRVYRSQQGQDGQPLRRCELGFACSGAAGSAFARRGLGVRFPSSPRL